MKSEFERGIVIFATYNSNPGVETAEIHVVRTLEQGLDGRTIHENGAIGKRVCDLLAQSQAVLRRNGLVHDIDSRGSEEWLAQVDQDELPLFSRGNFPLDVADKVLMQGQEANLRNYIRSQSSS